MGLDKNLLREMLEESELIEKKDKEKLNEENSEIKEVVKEVVEEKPVNIKTEMLELTGDPKFDKFKAKFIETQKYKAIAEFLQAQLDLDIDIVTPEEYIRMSYDHGVGSLKLVVSMGRNASMTTGDDMSYYVIKALTKKEYVEFQKEIGSREEKATEFIDYCLAKCVLTEIEGEINAGLSNILFESIIKHSDLNNIYRTVEL